MLTPDQIERCNALWRRLYARGAVRWMAGMRYASDSHRSDGFDRLPERLEFVAFQDWIYANPDFDDHATRGCLTAMAREATGDPALCARLCFARHADLPRWRAEGPDDIFATADNEPEALLLAIEEATNAK
jgi:hypothetical protein